MSTEEKKKFDLNKLKSQALIGLKKIGAYKLPAFIVFVIAIYGFVWFKSNSYTNAAPTDSQVSSQVQAAHLPHVDPTVLKQLQSLQDNSVSVQALFNQARNNPFNQ